MITFWSVLRTIVSLVLVISILIFIIVPAPVKPFIARWNRTTDYDASNRAVEKENYTLYSIEQFPPTFSSKSITADNIDVGIDEDERYILIANSASTSSATATDTAIASDKKLQQQQSQRRRLLVWFHGGAFLYSDRRTSYGLLNQLSDKLCETRAAGSNEPLSFDIIVFDYPVRFKYTIQQALASVNKTLSRFVGIYDEYYAGGMSAGVLLMGAFVHKEKEASAAERMKVAQIGLKFEALIGLCGLYDTRFDSKLLNVMFDFYIMRGTPAPDAYTCYNLSLPVLVIGANADYLYTQTYRFIKSEPCEYHIFKNPNLSHVFPLLENLAESRETVKRIVEFLSKIVGGKKITNIDDRVTK